MKRLFAWVAGAVGVSAAYRSLRRRPAAAAEDPAEELRAKLAEARDVSGPSLEEPATPLDPDARRREVHEQGRAAIDELRGD